MLAFAILTSFCLLYYNLPARSPAIGGATDHAWEKNKFYSRGTEGFALGQTNNEGYINSYDYQDGMNIDVLVMGTSHMEGYNVAMDENAAYQLDLLLEDDVVYNIGMSGHNFLTCTQNFEAAIEKYNPQKYVVMETTAVSYSVDKLQKAVDGTIEEISSNTDGILGLLQKIPLLRLLYSQFSNWKSTSAPNKSNSNSQNQSESDCEDLYLSLLNNLAQTAKAHDVQLIIFYQSNVYIDPETGLAVIKDAESIQRFASYCEKSGIQFVDMSERFATEYNQNRILPHGFANTSVGQGHLNKYGHRMVAEELSKIMGGTK